MHGQIGPEIKACPSPLGRFFGEMALCDPKGPEIGHDVIKGLVQIGYAPAMFKT